MDKFTIEFYEKENRDIPVEEFLLCLNVKMRAKAYRADYLERRDKNEEV